MNVQWPGAARPGDGITGTVAVAVAFAPEVVLEGTLDACVGGATSWSSRVTREATI